VVPPYYPFRVEKCIYLSRDVYVTGVAWRAVMRIEVGLEDLVQRIADGQSLV
jgi:hypothetical protein